MAVLKLKSAGLIGMETEMLSSFGMFLLSVGVLANSLALIYARKCFHLLDERVREIEKEKLDKMRNWPTGMLSD